MSSFISLEFLARLHTHTAIAQPKQSKMLGKIPVERQLTELRRDLCRGRARVVAARSKVPDKLAAFPEKLHALGVGVPSFCGELLKERTIHTFCCAAHVLVRRGKPLSHGP